MKCEYCNNEHNGEYGSGRFCNDKCARGYSTREKRKEINEKVREKLKGIKPKNPWYKGMVSPRKGKIFLNLRKPIIELKRWSSVRNRIFEKRGRICERCGWSEINDYYGIIPVQINHKDGNKKNNDENNLEILCPNCHSLSKYYMFFGRKHIK